jgi:hypothetical protein
LIQTGTCYGWRTVQDEHIARVPGQALPQVVGYTNKQIQVALKKCDWKLHYRCKSCRREWQQDHTTYDG